MKNNVVILASSSPRRIEMMNNHGINPVIIKPVCEETLPEGCGMEDAVLFLSLKKALTVEAEVKKDQDLLNKAPYIIAADTVVYKDKIIGKPEDKEDAFNILTSLRGEPHYVATGVSIICAGTAKRCSFCEVTKVYFNDYTDEELDAYLDTDEPYDKAGAYAIQGTFGKYVDHIEGDLDNVIGFPWARIVKEFDILANK